MGAIGGVFGLSGGQSGTGVDAPQQANIQTGVDTNQTAQSYEQNQAALAQQQALVSALQQQGGLKNQSNVYNQLQGVVNGTGPNPAQAMLNQQTGQNISNQAALAAGQRGSSANVGLMARQVGQQGGALQQQAVGQGATMQANQSLNALGQAGNIANTQVANQVGATGAYTGASQAEQANLLNALNAGNTARVGSQSSVNAGNTQLANTTMQGQQGVIGGMMSALGGAAGGGKARGGMIKGYDDGGEISPSSDTPSGGSSSEGIPLISATNTMPSGTGAGGIPLQSAANTMPSGMGPSGIPLQSAENGPASDFGQYAAEVDGGQPAQIAQIPAATANSGAEALYKGMSDLGGAVVKKMASSMIGGGGEEGGGGAGMAGMAAMMSDRNSKKNIKSGDGSTEEFLNNIGDHEYEYKESAGQDDKKHVGPMAQELEKSTTGKQMVSDSPKGKMVDYSKSGPAILASLAFLHKEIKSLKEGKGYGSGGEVSNGKMVDVVVSPGEIIISPENVSKAAGGKVDGKMVPGKAPVKGDSQKNDIVKTKLPEGTVVVPRTKSKDNSKSAAFVRETLAKRGRK